MFLSRLILSFLFIPLGLLISFSAFAQSTEGAEKGRCGTATLALWTSAPNEDLCQMGSATAVVGFGPWAWKCLGVNGGATSACLASVSSGQGGQQPGLEPIRGTSDTVQPSDAMSAPSDGMDSKNTNPLQNPTTVDVLTTPPAPRLISSARRGSQPINASCGAATSVLFHAAPTGNLCATGEPSNVVGLGPWIWTCSGINGGTSTSCATTYSLSTVNFSIVQSPTVLLSNDQRLAIGIKEGPDSATDFYTSKNGQSYLLASGVVSVGGIVYQGTYALHTDQQMQSVIAMHSTAPAGAGDVQMLLLNHDDECVAPDSSGLAQSLKSADAGGVACSQYFDRNVVNGGTYFLCPDRTTSLLFYDGANHVGPDGTQALRGGWSGSGVGYFNAGESRVTRSTQMPTDEGKFSSEISGVNMSNQWVAVKGVYPKAPQADIYSMSTSAVPSPDGKSIYVYHNNATPNAAYNPAYCNPGGCYSVSSAPTSAFCNNVNGSQPVAWQNYYQGAFTQPAVYGLIGGANYGSGGPFTPVILDPPADEHGGSVTYIPSHRMYVMLRLLTGLGQGSSIAAHYSSDGITWSAAYLLMTSPAGLTPLGEPEEILYPRLHVIMDSNGTEQYVMTYTLASSTHTWKWAELIRQPLQLSF